MKPRKQPRTPTLLLLALSGLTSASQLPFQPAETISPLARRQQQQGGCLANFYSCANQGAAFTNICCANGQVCRLDAANQPACCPANAVCTGTAPASFSPPSATSISYVPNTYFSFPYAPTSFADSAACSSAVSQCGVNYDSCTSRLEGAAGAAGGNGGVTVVVPGQGGTTVVGGGGQAGVTLATASATSICSSLSSAACGGLQDGMCSGAGVTTGGFVIGTGTVPVTGNAAAARQTGCAVGMMVVAGVGIVNGL